MDLHNMKSNQEERRGKMVLRWDGDQQERSQRET